jgi:N-acyl-D-aspartate/D-glutamate deacylase
MNIGGIIVFIYVIVVGVIVLLANEVNSFVRIDGVPVRSEPSLGARSIDWGNHTVDLSVPVKNKSIV